MVTPTSGKTSSTTILYVTLPLNGVSGGYYHITVRNNDRVNSTAQDIFSVTDPAMTKPGQNGGSRSPVLQNPGVPKVGSVLPATGDNPISRQVYGGCLVLKGGTISLIISHPF